MAESLNSSFGEKIANSEVYKNVQDGLANVTTTIGDGLENLKGGLNNVVGDFSNQNVASQGSAFLESNSIISKFVFLIMVLVGFFILMNLGMYIVSWFTTQSKSPYIFNGMFQLSKKGVSFQDPKSFNPVTIFRSNNEDKGIEFTWSSWLKIEDVQKSINETSSTVPLHLFNKGSDPSLSKGLVFSNDDDNAEVNYDFGVNGPGVYVVNNNNEFQLKIYMDYIVSGITNKKETVTIKDIPVNKWFHLAIRLQNKVLDHYINGTIVSRTSLSNVPKQNYGEVYWGYGGVDGQISNLRYFDQALNVFQISNIVLAGPNLKNPSEDEVPTRKDYLSGSWYSNQD